jgi:hypothetical protein
VNFRKVNEIGKKDNSINDCGKCNGAAKDNHVGGK